MEAHVHCASFCDWMILLMIPLAVELSVTSGVSFWVHLISCDVFGSVTPIFALSYRAPSYASDSDNVTFFFMMYEDRIYQHPA